MIVCSTYLQCKSNISSQSFPSEFPTPFHLLSEPQNIQNLLDWIEIFSIFAPILSNVNIHRDVFPKEFRTYSAGYGGQRGREVLQFKTKTCSLKNEGYVICLAGQVTTNYIEIFKISWETNPLIQCLVSIVYRNLPLTNRNFLVHGLIG